MYKGKVLGKLVKVNNKDYEQLLRKFNLKSIKEDSILYDFKIDVKCRYCYKYNNFKILDTAFGMLKRPYCKPKCPFAQFETDDEVGCMDIMINFVGEKNWPIIRGHSHIGWESISWEATIDTHMRGLITTLRNELLKMKKEKND